VLADDPDHFGVKGLAAGEVRVWAAPGGDAARPRALKAEGVRLVGNHVADLGV
jgi:hypothetical protein